MMWHVWMSLQIILEMVPISSSGHLHLFEYFSVHVLKKTVIFPIKDAANDIFFNCIQFPTILIIASYFFKQWFFLVRNFVRCRFIIAKLCAIVFVADAITCGFYVCIKHYHLFTIPLWAGFLITLLTLASSYWLPQRNHRCTLVDAALLGCVQGVALLPGISRLATTFIVARWRGICARRSFELSWLLELPLIGAAFFKTILFDNELLIWSDIITLNTLISIGVSSGIAVATLYATQKIMERNKTYYFAWYMLVPLALSLVWCVT